MSNTWPSTQANLWKNARFDEQGSIWIGVCSSECRKVLVDPLAKRVARFWISLLSSGNRLHFFWSPTGSDIVGAADAWAHGSGAGIGGWISLSGSLDRSELHWFSIQFAVNDIPAWWEPPQDLQTCISSFELLAQTALVVCKCLLTGRAQFQGALTFESDSTPAEGAGNKLFSTNPRLSPLVLNLAAWATKANVEVRIQHIPGARNDLADALSRGRLGDHGLRDDRHIYPEWEQLWCLSHKVTLAPSNAFWQPYVMNLGGQHQNV